MAGRSLSTKITRSGRRGDVKRTDNAIVHGTRNPDSSPMTSEQNWLLIGLVLVALILGGAFLLKTIKPAPQINDSVYVTTVSGGQYVKYDGALHPVSNLASARLILGSPVQAKTVEDKALETMRMDKPIGIPVAPNNLTAIDKGDETSWSLINIPTEQSPFTTKNIKTSEIVVLSTEVPDERVNHKLTNSDGVVVKALDDNQEDKLWVLWGGKRSQLTPNASLMNVLGISQTAIDDAPRVDSRLLTAIPLGASLSVDGFSVEKEGSKLQGKEWVVGDVLHSTTLEDKPYFGLITQNGIQEIPAYIAQIRQQKGYKVFSDLAFSQIMTIPNDKGLSLDLYPEQGIKISEDKHPIITLSSTMSRKTRTITTSILVGSTIPFNKEQLANSINLSPAQKNNVSADTVLVNPGKGWLVRVINGGEAIPEQLWYVDSTGVRFPIAEDEQNFSPKNALGFEGIEPYYVSWDTLKLFTPGASLDRKNALVYHTNIKDDLNEQEAPQPTQGGK